MILKAYLGLGSNLGDRLSKIYQAERLIQEIGIEIKKYSSIYESEAWGLKDQPDFLNRVIAIHTTLYPLELLEKLLSIEKYMGRQRDIKWGPRLIDIDILDIEGIRLTMPEISVPHPFVENRKFVLLPWLELNPEDLKLQEMLSKCSDTAWCRVFKDH
jgi:2-amino-4-hydroxy-6-hydroxymethyldihydropteridine diphosphokinase